MGRQRLFKDIGSVWVTIPLPGHPPSLRGWSPAWSQGKNRPQLQRRGSCALPCT